MELKHRLSRRRQTALHLRKTRQAPEEFKGVTEAMIVMFMTDDQVDEYVDFMALQPVRFGMAGRGR